MFVPVAEWLPDQPPFNNPGGNRAFNVIPGYNCYEPMPAMTLKATGPTGEILGSINARDQANNNYTYCGDVSALYVQSGVSLVPVTKVSATYAVANQDTWEFVPWNQTVIATNGTDPMQVISLGAANFVDLGGGSPKARHLAIINNFVVAGNISDSATQVQRVRWSALNNSGSWTQDATVLADLQDLPGDGGWVQKIVGGEQGGFVFQERKIWAMNFVGSPLIFQFNPIHQNVGAYAAQSVINFENLIYFLADSGFYSFDGTNVTPIGQGKVDKTFFADLDTSNIANIRAAIWPEKKLVMWAYPGIGNVGGRPNHIMVYSWQYQRWSRIDIPQAFDSGSISHIALTATPGVTLEGLDAYCASNMDALVISMDDRSWTGGQLIFSAFSGGSLYYWNGTAMSADVETTELNPQMQIYPNVMMQQNDNIRLFSQINEVWPAVDGLSQSAVAIAISSRAKLTDPISEGQAMSPISAGFVESRLVNRFFRFRMTTDGATDFNFIQGVDIQFEGAGKR